MIEILDENIDRITTYVETHSYDPDFLAVLLVKMWNEAVEQGRKYERHEQRTAQKAPQEL